VRKFAYINNLAPAFGRGFAFFSTVLSIAVWMELIRQLYLF
jgi:hypothetical protein